MRFTAYIKYQQVIIIVIGKQLGKNWEPLDSVCVTSASLFPRIMVKLSHRPHSGASAGEEHAGNQVAGAPVTCQLDTQRLTLGHESLETPGGARPRAPYV